MNLLNISKWIINIGSFSVPFIVFLTSGLDSILWDLALFAVFLLMIIRPLNDLFPTLRLIRFISFRKNLGIFSAMIVVSFGVLHYISLGSDFFSTYFSLSYWSFENNLFWAHMGELTGFILLITSNRFSMRLLKRNWKRIQRLSYLYFFSGSWYVFALFHKTIAVIYIIVVFEFTIAAFIKKRVKFEQESQRNSV